MDVWMGQLMIKYDNIISALYYWWKSKNTAMLHQPPNQDLKNYSKTVSQLKLWEPV